MSKHTKGKCEVLLHDISYYYDDDRAISNSEQEHISYMITQGYREGELNEDEIRGYWQI